MLGGLSEADPASRRGHESEASEAKEDIGLIIDFHIHFTPEEIVRRGNPAVDDGPRVVYQDGIPSYTLHRGLFTLDGHLQAMDLAGIRVAVLSSGAGMAGDLPTCRLVNEWAAAAKGQHPGRFEALAHLPPFGGEEALDELRRCRSEWGFPGAVTTSSIDGRSLDDPGLDPYYAALEELGMFLFIHPALGVPSTGVSGYDAYDLYRCVGREFDLVLATLRLILGGVFDRHPGLQVVMSHLGGGIPSLLDRVRGYQDKEHMGVAGDPRHGVTSAAPLDSYLARSMFFDTGGLFGSVTAIKAALLELPADRIVFGSDYPQEIRTPEAMAGFVERLKNSDLPPATVDGIMYSNGAHLLGRPELVGHTS